MDAEYFPVDNGAEGEVIENFGAISPDCDGAVFAQTLIVESVDLRDLARLVIPANQHDAVRISDF